jgi:PAS domain S-box-containing protein
MDILDSILDNIDQSVIITNREGEMLFFNKEAVHTLGTINRTPLKVGEHILSYASTERKKVVNEIFHDLTVHKKTIRTWAEYTQLNGLTMHLELNYIPVLDDHENISYISVLGRDITASKIFERKIRAQAANVENLIQKANALIMSTDSRGYITNWNDHCTIITGFEKNEVYAKRLTDVILHDSVRTDFNDLIVRILNLEGVQNYETKFKTKDSKILTCLVSATPQLTTTGQAVGITFVGQDITELTEYRRSLEDRIEERTVELRLALQKEKELVEMKNRFVSIASHEFRTPLSSIQFSANFLKQYNHRIQDPERHQKLDNIVAQVEHMASLLDDVLAYGKNEAGKINIITSKINLAEFITKIMEEVGHSTKNTHKILLEFYNTPIEIETDEKLLRSILVNLLTNAIKFSPHRERIYITVSGIGKHLQLLVRDEGIGIPQHELEDIFQPFLRGKGVASIPGTGLGLSITKKAVELLGGSLKAESQVDQGTTFTVLIPYKKI